MQDDVFREILWCVLPTCIAHMKECKDEDEKAAHISEAQQKVCTCVDKPRFCEEYNGKR